MSVLVGPGNVPFSVPILQEAACTLHNADLAARTDPAARAKVTGKSIDTKLHRSIALLVSCFNAPTTIPERAKDAGKQTTGLTQP